MSVEVLKSLLIDLEDNSKKLSEIKYNAYKAAKNLVTSSKLPGIYLVKIGAVKESIRPTVEIKGSRQYLKNIIEGCISYIENGSI